MYEICSAASSDITMAETDRPASAIETEFHYLTERIDYLESRLEELLARLRPISSDANNSKTKEASTTSVPPSCMIEGLIAESRRRLERVNFMIEEQIDNLRI